LRYTIYLLSLKEWNLDWLMSEYVWMPFKRAGRKISFTSFNISSIIFAVLLVSGIIDFQIENAITDYLHRFLPEFYALFGLILVLKSFAERENAWHAFTLILMNNFMVAMAISFNEHFEFSHTVLYLSGIVVAGIIGYFSLFTLRKKEIKIDLKQFYGHSYKHPKLAFLFLFVCIDLSGFPVTPTFIGEDLIYSHIDEHQAILALVVSISLIVDGLSLIRIYSRLFLGTPIKRFHEVGFRSS
jgi:NADH-quinone oxidoreductase subunit L